MTRGSLMCLALAGCLPEGPVQADLADALAQPRQAPPGVADVVLRGRLYTVDASQPWAEALAMRQGEIVYVGDEAGARAWYGPGTRLVTLPPSQVVMPGLHDVHVHVLEAFHTAINCLVSTGANANTMAWEAAICRPSSGTDWVLGWGHDIQDLLGTARPPKAYLDDWFPNTPVAIMEFTSHSTWVNSEALFRLGIDASTPNPSGGLIGRTGSGAPNGLLIDAAGELPWDLALAPNAILRQKNSRALRDGLEALAQNGITSAGDARVYWKRGYLDAYQDVLATGGMTARMTLGLWAYPDMSVPDLVSELSALYADPPGDLLSVDQIKVYADGITTHTTARLLEPYDTTTLGPRHGLRYFSPSELQALIEGLAPVGFDFHIHAIGDGGVRGALDAIEAANAPARRHRLTHIELVAPADVPRFSALDVTADMQLAAWTDPSQLPDLYPLLGPARVDERAWPLRSLYDAGARVTLSSDYDVGTLSPFHGMARAVDRGAQSLPSIDDAIRAYTIDAAYALGQDHLVGSLEVGKRADLVVVDRDPTTTHQLANTRVLYTVLDGRLVYQR